MPSPFGGGPKHSISEKMIEVRRQQSKGAEEEEEMLIEEGADSRRTRRIIIATVVAIAVFILSGGRPLCAHFIHLVNNSNDYS